MVLILSKALRKMTYFDANSTLYQVENGLQHYLEEHTQASIGQIIGRKQQLISNWGCDLDSWRARPFLLLCFKDTPLRSLLLKAFDICGESRSANLEKTALVNAKIASDLISEIMAAMMDHEITPEEKPRLKELCRMAIDSLQTFYRDLLDDRPRIQGV